MNERLWLFTLASLGGITALSIDIYLPGLPQIAADMGTSMTQVQWTLSGFVIAFALGMLLYGPISDRFGRKKPLLFGLALYLTGTVMSWAAGSIEFLVFARLVQGLGASSGSVSCLSIARDRFEGPEMTRALALVGAVIGLAPIIAPLIGGVLQTVFDWRASFVFLALFGSLLWLWVFFMLPETKAGNAQPLTATLKQYRKLITHPEFVVFTSLNTFAFLGIFAFLTMGGPIIMGSMGVSSSVFSVLFASNASMFLVGNLLTARLTRSMSVPNIVVMGVWILGLGGLIMLGLSWTNNLWALMIPMHLVTLGGAIVMIMGNAGSIAPFREIAGSASALAGFLRFAAAGLLAGTFSTLQSAQAIHLALTIVVFTLVCVTATVRLYAAQKPNTEELIAPAA